MKTITQWLQSLPEPYRSQALNQPENIQFEGFPHSRLVKDLHEALNVAFLWADTEQGSEYWGYIAGRAEDGEFDKLGIDCTIPEGT